MDRNGDIKSNIPKFTRVRDRSFEFLHKRVARYCNTELKRRIQDELLQVCNCEVLRVLEEEPELISAYLGENLGSAEYALALKEVGNIFGRAKDEEGGIYLGIFEGYSLIEGPPARPDEMPRITLFIDTLAQAANYRRKPFLREVRVTYLHELGHYFGWDEGELADVGLE